MRVDDHHLAEFREQGFTIVPGFLNDSELATAQAALPSCFPTPADYFTDPDRYDMLQQHQFSGLRVLPFDHLDLNLLSVHDDLIDVAQRLLETPDVRLYKGELWAKYGGGVDYDQFHHRDFGNHSLVVPRADGRATMLTTFIYLCDVGPANGATAVVPIEHTRQVPLGVRAPQTRDLEPFEVRASAPAGSLLIYSTAVFHRGTSFTDPTGSRFMILADFRRADAPWVQKQAFGDKGNSPRMAEFVTAMTPAQRTLLDIPAPGHWYWNDQTISDMAIRYPDIDMSPYITAQSSEPRQR